MAPEGARAAALAGAAEAAGGRAAAGRRLLTGAQAAAEAMRQIDPDVVPVYPITPQTPIIEAFARHLADGRAHGEMVHVESEHSAMSAAVGSALAGARTMTATASQGLAYMVEVLYLAASLRAPVVVAVGNRALSGPINIHGDHSDAMLARDSGAVQLFAENAQEAYDLMLCAPRLCEHPEVRLPALVGQDGFTISHSAEPVSLVEDEEARAFVGPYREEDALLAVDRPLTHGALAMPDAYFEIKVEQARALERAEGVWAETAAAYHRLSGRDVAAVEPYRLEGARRVLVAMGSVAGTAKDVVDELRARGEEVGLLKIRLFRPFPRARIAALLAGATAVGVLDRALSPGGWPPLYSEVAATLAGRARVQSFVGGLGGRDLGPEELLALFAALGGAGGQEPVYLGLGRGGWR
jgi:pyruvate ferredoxin oxidoreductase alpha subunit